MPLTRKADVYPSREAAPAIFLTSWAGKCVGGRIMHLHDTRCVSPVRLSAPRRGPHIQSHFPPRSCRSSLPVPIPCLLIPALLTPRASCVLLDPPILPSSILPSPILPSSHPLIHRHDQAPTSTSTSPPFNHNFNFSSAFPRCEILFLSVFAISAYVCGCACDSCVVVARAGCSRGSKAESQPEGEGN